jgi:dienelactone hydrolase
MKKIIFILLILCTRLVDAQTFPVGHISVNCKDDTRSGGYSIAGAIQLPGVGRDIGVEIYYPATSAGTSTPVAIGAFPVIVFGHGFVMTYDNYDNIYNDLASRGYIVALPRTEGGFSPNHLDFGADLAFLATKIQQFDTITTPSSLLMFNGKVIQKAAIGGHSMGGGCSFIGAENNTHIACLFNMAAATSNTSGVSSIDGAALVSVPTLMLSGQRDCVADTNVQNSHYANLAAANKFQVILKDLTHCDFGNGSSATCTFGQTTSGCANTISNTIATARYLNFLVPFLNSELKNDCAEGDRFMDSINANSSTLIGKKVEGAIGCRHVDIEPLLPQQAWLSVYPNPATHFLMLSFDSQTADTSYDAFVSDAAGRVVFQKKLVLNAVGQQLMKIDISTLAKGTYLLTMKSAQQHATLPFQKE